MLNYNLNIIEPSKQEKKNEDVRPPIFWSFASFASASDSTDLGELGFATMSINAVNSNCIQISQDATGFFETDAQFPVTASMTGSNWPITGSTTMSLYTAGITYDPASVNQYYFAAISASALDIYNNPSYTASKITNNFSASEFFRFYPEGRIYHTKGNVYNPVINWRTKNVSTINDYTQVNGYSASFSIVKDANVSLASIQEVTGSAQSGSFNNNYALNITASFTANVNNVTGSTTMSFEIPQAGLVQTAKFFNPNTTVAYGTGSFVAISNSPYAITSSVIFNKGNLSTASINWNQIAKSDSQDLENDGNFINGNSSSFNIVKDKNVSVISYPYASASHNGTFSNDYAFNITSSLTASILANTTGSVTMSLIIPEIGFSTSSKFYNETSAGVYIFSASFIATTDSSSYNITGSIINNKGNIWNSKLNFLATGSNYDSYSMYTVPTQFNIFKDVNVNPIVVQQNVNLLAYPLTSSKTDTLQTQYAFNFQSDVTESAIYPSYQVFAFPTTSLNITPAGTSSIRYDSGSKISYTESPYTGSYNITASAWINKIPSFAANLIVIGAGGSGAGSTDSKPGGGGGAGGYYQNDIQIYPNKTYTINYVGTGGATALTGSSGKQGGNTGITIWQGLWQQPTTMSIISLGGYGGGYPNQVFTDITDGGASGYAFTQTGSDTVTVTNNYIGQNGGYDNWGGGGGGQLATGYLGDGGLQLGGAGGNSISATYIFSGSSAPTSSYQGNILTSLTGSSGYGVAYPGNNGNPATAYGGGGGGASRTDISGLKKNGGRGGNGVIILSYSGSQKITGGDISFVNGVTIHTFTTASTFIYTIEPKPNPAEQSYQWRADTLVIAGGGCGGSDEGAGGGAGGYSFNPYVWYEVGKTYAVTIGNGAAARTSNTTPYSGSNSYLTDTSNNINIITALGGGNGFGNSGGSGGGATTRASGGGGATYGLNINQNFYSALFQSQGFGGGAHAGGLYDYAQSGGGGGAATTGSNGYGTTPNPNSGAGGTGKYDLSFTPIAVCGGGQGSYPNGGEAAFVYGGGASGNPATAGAVNTGGGGGGGTGVGVFSGAGGSGKVQIKYVGTARATGGTIETQLVSGSYYTLHTFTGSGNFIPTR